MNDSEKGRQLVNRCTPWHHLKCVFITGKEVFKDGKEGKSTRHWWRISYIGRACIDQYGKITGTLYEGLFVIPHYTAMALGNGLGLLVFVANRLKHK